MSIRLLSAISIAGVAQPVGTSLTLDAAMEASLVSGNVAEYVTPPTGQGLGGTLTPNIWTRIPSIWRLRLTGTGTCTLDARDSTGAITLAFATYTASAATDQIEFPFAGANAVEIRATLTGTITAEVI